MSETPTIADEIERMSALQAYAEGSVWISADERFGRAMRVRARGLAKHFRALERDHAKMKAALEGLSSVARILVQDGSVRGSLSLEGWIATAYNTLDSLEVK